MLKTTFVGFCCTSKIILSCAYLIKKSKFQLHVLKYVHISRRSLVLGIETSCDDTGVALINREGVILGNSLCSQQGLHLKYGGIIPPVAQEYHRCNIETAVNYCLLQSKYDLSEIDAIAVTNRPGLFTSLLVGIRYAKHLCRRFSKPIIPIHHMEAHALMVRRGNNIPFPFLCLLISGGHCQLTLVKGVNNFYLLGGSFDNAPGETFDKVARRLKIRNMEKFSNLCGGAAIELAASESNGIERCINFPLPLARMKMCQFSFAGLKNNALRCLKKKERENGIQGDEIISDYQYFCASFLKAVTRHISSQTQKAIKFCLKKQYFDGLPKHLVVSGGVASNDVIFDSVKRMAETYGFKTCRPPKKYCSDNGVMIAWNGVEKIMEDDKCLQNEIDNIEAIGKCSLGKNFKHEVYRANITCKLI